MGILEREMKTGYFCRLYDEFNGNLTKMSRESGYTIPTIKGYLIRGGKLERKVKKKRVAD